MNSVNICKNRQRLEDCIVVLKAPKVGDIGELAAMIAAKAIIDKAIVEHEKWKKKNEREWKHLLEVAHGVDPQKMEVD